MRLEDDDDKPPRLFYELLVIGLAALLTLCGIGLCFFSFTVPQEKLKPYAAETVIGIGKGSTINGSGPKSGRQP